MFTPQRHSISASTGLDQMLQLPYGHMPLPSPIMDRSSTTTRWKPNIEIAPNCPRCASTNTKFCYYNNYSLSQPRYFCKGCRRYWTKGGSLRNVPVGGGCRKNRRGKSSRHHHHSERISSVFEDRESSAGEGDQASDTNGSRDIDMALVFAKFLNQNPISSGDQEIDQANNNASSSSNNFSTSLTTPESVEIIEKDAVVQPQKESDVIGEDPFEGTNQSLIGGEELSLSGIELEGFLGEDVVWSDATMGSSVTWQPPMMQLQEELEYSMPFNDEEGGQLLPISSSVSLMSDSWSGWSSFDLSTIEVFSSTP